MGATAAQVASQRIADLLFAGLGCFVEQGLRGHQHAVDAIATLRGLRVNEGLLQTVGLGGRAQTLKRGDGFGLHRLRGGDTRADRLAIDHDGAGTALTQAATEFRALQAQLVTQGVQQWNVWISVELSFFTVDLQANGGHGVFRQ